MTQQQHNRFRPRKVSNIEGFEIACYDSLLARERFRLLDVRKEIFSGVKQLLALAGDVSEALGVDTDVAWVILQNQGIAPDGTDHKAAMMPFLMRMAELRDSDAQNQRYLRASVEIILASRLSPDWLLGALGELTEAYPIDLAPEEVDHFGSISQGGRIYDKRCIKLARSIADGLPDDVYDKLIDFIQLEENYGKPPEVAAADEEGDEENPKPPTSGKE